MKAVPKDSDCTRAKLHKVCLLEGFMKENLPFLTKREGEVEEQNCLCSASLVTWTEDPVNTEIMSSIYWNLMEPRDQLTTQKTLGSVFLVVTRGKSHITAAPHFLKIKRLCFVNYFLIEMFIIW